MPSPEPPSTSPGAQPATPPVAFSDCRQYHTYFPIRADDVQANVPQGFTQPTDEAGMTVLRIEATDCTAGPDGERLAMMWITLPVIPPDSLANPDYAHVVAIEAYVDDDVHLDRLQAWGAHLAEACACAATSGPIGDQLVDGFTVDGEEDDYTMQAVLAPSSGEFPEERGMTYIAEDGRAVGRIVAHNAASTTRGFGAVTLAYLGPGAAPPVFPGDIAHVVQGLEFTIAYEVIA